LHVILAKLLAVIWVAGDNLLMMSDLQKHHFLACGYIVSALHVCCSMLS